MRYFLITAAFCLSALSFSQNSPTKSGELYQNAPYWAKEMYKENPNVFYVDKLYKEYYTENTYSKSFHTQYYKRWRKAIGNFLNDNGYFDVKKKNKLRKIIDRRKSEINTKRNDNPREWSVIGPFQNFKEGGVISSGAQGNIYSIGQCKTKQEVMYCGTENGEVYKTTDGGDNWFNVSLNLVTALAPQVVLANAGIKAIAVHPTNPDIVYAGSGSEIFKTTDGGLNWNVVFDSDIPLYGYIENPAEILINQDDPQIVLVASKAGIHKSIDGGLNWNKTLDYECFDIKSNVNDSNVLYTIRKNDFSNNHEFLISNDGGSSWTPQLIGWYFSNNPSRTVEGARIALTGADENRIYAFLIGDSKPGDNGFIGIYRSNDGGLSWSNTMGYDGAPYTASEHPNLISSDPITSDFSFNQGFYNCAIMASNTNADELLVGGIGMWRSSDGGASFNCMYNYLCGNYEPMHVDMQDFRAFGNEYWASTDGGIYKSNDLFASQPEFKMKGIHAVDFWGFDSGWNHDLLVGGTFHNGVDVYYEGFPKGTFLDLGGGEPASGYVNPGNDLRIYSTNVGSKIVPESINGAIINRASSIFPNESPWFALSSEMIFHPSCYNTVYLGRNNQLFKSEDGGATYVSIYDASPNSEVLDLEISRSNTSVMYAIVRQDSGSVILLKSEDDWKTSENISLPNFGGNSALITINPENENIIWLAYARGNDDNKVFKSINGGESWTNQTSNDLDGQNIQSIVSIGGTDGGVYIGTSTSVYYKNNSMNSWVSDNNKLPLAIGINALKPFYRDGKIRLASYGKGIWESSFLEEPTRPVAKIMVDKLSSNCISETFYFDDYSMLNHDNASWAWTFENADISSSNLRNPEVTFNSSGTHQITLTVTNKEGISSTDNINISIDGISTTEIKQDFENDLLKEGWTEKSTGNYFWTYNSSVGGYGTSSNCMVVNNYEISQPGTSCDIIAPINMSSINQSDAILSFDIAYARYNDAYQDGLEVLVSLDCGSSFTKIYSKYGSDLATAPDSETLFEPLSYQWRTESIDLNSFLGNSNVSIAFRNINGFGNALYIDNINLGGEALSFKDETFENILVYPNPANYNESITIKSDHQKNMVLKLYDVQGKLITKKRNIIPNTKIKLNDFNLTPGVYIYEITSNNKIKKGKLLISGMR